MSAAHPHHEVKPPNTSPQLCTDSPTYLHSKCTHVPTDLTHPHSYCTDDPDADRALAVVFGETIIDGYLGILGKSSNDFPDYDETDRSEQLAYHTLYLFQVLTLDRGTTSGLLVHDQNDMGIMGSLPSHVDRDLLATWKEKVEKPQQPLVQELLGALPEGNIVAVTDAVKLDLAKAVRDHYKRNPESLSYQASGNVVPPTVDNHR